MEIGREISTVNEELSGAKRYWFATRCMGWRLAIRWGFVSYVGPQRGRCHSVRQSGRSRNLFSDEGF